MTPYHQSSIVYDHEQDLVLHPILRHVRSRMSDQSRPDISRSILKAQAPVRTPTATLQQVPINPNTKPPILPVPSPGAMKSSSQEDDSKLAKFGLPAPRLPSNARCNTLVWSKLSTGKNDNKENTSQGPIMTPSESLDSWIP